MTVWYNDSYYYYASLIIVISVASIVLDVYTIRSQETRLRNMVHSVDVVKCYRDRQVETITSDQLVPGDVIHLAEHGAVMQCDTVLLSGSCIVNESMLTGESVPVTKTALPIADPDSDTADSSTCIYSHLEHSKHTLFCGTTLLQTRYQSPHYLIFDMRACN